MATVTKRTFKYGLEDGTNFTLPNTKSGITASNVNAASKAFAKLRPSKSTLKVKIANDILTSVTDVEGYSDKPIGEIE